MQSFEYALEVSHRWESVCLITRHRVTDRRHGAGRQVGRVRLDGNRSSPKNSTDETVHNIIDR